MSERSDEEGSVGSDNQQIPNDMKYSSAEAAAKDKLYEPKKKRKIIRVLTVMAYVFSVSLAAIMLSLYYVFLWDPKIPSDTRSPMALRVSEQPGLTFAAVPVGNVSCSHLTVQEEAVALPQLQEPETTIPMDADDMRRSTPVPLLHSRLSQIHPHTIPSTVSNHQTHTNFTMNQLHGT